MKVYINGEYEEIESTEFDSVETVDETITIEERLSAVESAILEMAAE